MIKVQKVLGIDWVKDLESCEEPPHYFFEYSSGEKYRNVTISHPLVYSDPADCMIINGVEKHYHPTCIMWEKTIDYYLDRYHRLMWEKLNEIPLDLKKGSPDCKIVYLPSPIADALRHYQKRVKKERRWIRSNTHFIKYISELSDSKQDSEDFIVMNAIAPNYLHFFCRDMTITGKAKNYRNHLECDGLKFSMEDYDDFIPEFSMFHYIEHEISTGVSLAIEITAILLEMKNFLDSIRYTEDLKAYAYEIFNKELLPNLLESHLIFTRITVARRFFQQIMLETMLSMYQGNVIPAFNTQPLSVSRKDQEKLWDSWIQRALSFRSFVSLTGEYTPISVEDREPALKECEDTIFCMEAPIKFSELCTATNKRLAIFCNPNHAYVDLFVQSLDERANLASDIFGRHRSSQDILFQKVYSDIRKIQETE